MAAGGEIAWLEGADLAFKEAFGGSHEVVGIWGTAKAFDPPLIAKSISQNVTREPRYDDDL